MVPGDPPIPDGLSYKSTFAWADGGMFHAPKASLYRSMHDISEGSGIVGNPALASVEKGRRISSYVLEELSQLTRDLNASD